MFVNALYNALQNYKQRINDNKLEKTTIKSNNQVQVLKAHWL